jgi:hypothetical protein
MNTIIQLNPQIVVYTPLGKGLAFFLIDYGMSVNTCWVVRLANGEIKHFDANDIRAEGNPTYGIPMMPELPASWNTAKEKAKEKQLAVA